ncbi:MAG: hypothetical protein IJX46_05525 [Clostridia bacterium]|nr:hypothetical protein [Clostridia bacterium]
MEETKKSVPLYKKILRIAGNVLLFIFLALCIFTLVLTVFSPKDETDGTAELFGYQLRTVISDSMGACEDTDVSDYDIKSIPLYSMVFVQLVPDDPAEAAKWYEDIRVGDVLTVKYVYDTQVTITHRVIEKNPDGKGGYHLVLEGDNKNTENQEQLRQEIFTSEKDSYNYVVGKVTGQSVVLGSVVSLLRSPLGIIFIIIMPCVLIILFEVIKIVGVLRSDKRRIEKEENAKKDKELDELRRKLAELEGQKADLPTADEDESEVPTDSKAETSEEKKVDEQ